MKRLFLITMTAVAVIVSDPAMAATCPAFSYGYVLTAAQWQACFDAKQNTLGYAPVNKAGDVMTGRLVIPTPTGTRASFNLTPGTAPSNPVDGDIWVTSSDVGAEINGVTLSLISPSVANITGLGAGVATFLATPSSANFAAAVTGETGTGALVFGTSPLLTTPALAGSTSGSLTLSTAAIAGANTFKFPAGSTDLTGTGGAGQFLKQSSAGAALTVGTIGASDLPVATTGAFGAVKPDGTTVTISSGVISSATFVATTKAQQQTATSNVVGVTPLHQQDHDSAVKAWVSATQSGGTYSGVSSYNATFTAGSSGPGTGVVNITWTVPFATTAYAVICGLNQTTGGNTISENYASRLAGSTQMQIRTSSNTAVDSNFSCMALGRQ